MAARLTAFLPRLLALTVIWLLGAATYTLAADKLPAAGQQDKAADVSKPHVLTVPDVRKKAYVFAKGILQDAGFAWRVEGSVKGYAANPVSVQNPAPGTKVIDNGAPIVVLSLVRNTDPRYTEHGLPEDTAPYKGTRVVLESDWEDQHTKTETEEATTAPTPSETASTTTEPSATTNAPEEPVGGKDDEKHRKPDFVIPGVPAEPADEITLPARARKLQQHVASAEKSTARLVNFWLYQHSWIITGARYGWHDGAEALRILIKVDQSLERRFGYGAKSEAVARRALDYVEAQAK